jgi:hypothetical protein
LEVVANHSTWVDAGMPEREDPEFDSIAKGNKPLEFFDSGEDRTVDGVAPDHGGMSSLNCWGFAISTLILIQLKIRENYHTSKSNSDPRSQLLAE